MNTEIDREQKQKMRAILELGGSDFGMRDLDVVWMGNEPHPTEAEIATKLREIQDAEPLEALREKRNSLLTASDWTGLADSALTSETSAKWKLYRQRLRDFPSGLNTPAKVKAAKWPAKPV